MHQPHLDQGPLPRLQRSGGRKFSLLRIRIRRSSGNTQPPYTGFDEAGLRESGSSLVRRWPNVGRIVPQRRHQARSPRLPEDLAAVGKAWPVVVGGRQCNRLNSSRGERNRFVEQTASKRYAPR